MDNREHFKQLLESYQDGSISQRDRDELFRELESPANDALWPELIREITMSAGEDSQYDRARFEPVIQKILGNERPAYTSEEAPVYSISRRKKSRVSWAAAACIFFIGGGLYHHFYTQRSTANSQLSTANNELPTDISPGTSKATLTLSNGLKILLDSARTGLLAQQSGADVMKSGNGSLSYENSHPGSAGTIFPYSHITYNTLTTPRGGQYQLTLPDGTKVWLDAASSITYPTSFAGNERKVEITGEMYFEVIHNAKMPFRVQAGGQTIEDIGTTFNVNAYSDEPATKTTLLEGSLMVTMLSSVNKQLSTANHQLPTILKPGQAFTNGKIVPTNVDQDMAWKNGLFNFEGARLPDVMRQLSRWYDLQVVYEKGVPDIEFGGKMSRNVSLSGVLDGLAGAGVHFRIEANHRLVVMP